MFTKVCKWVSILGAMTFAIAVPGCDQASTLLNTLMTSVTGLLGGGN